MKIGGKVTNPGELNQRVVLAQRKTERNAAGETVTWEYVAEAWAKWTNAHGSEAWTADSLGYKKPATVLMRYRSGMDTSYAVVLGATVSDIVEDGVVVGKTFTGGELYEVVSMDDIANRHEYIELKVQRTNAG